MTTQPDGLGTLFLGCSRADCGRSSRDDVHSYIAWLDGAETAARHRCRKPRCRACGKEISAFNLARLCGGLRPCDGGDTVALD